MPDLLTRLIYVDDSGHQATGLCVYGWVHFSPDRWAHVLRRWLDLRKMLQREYGIDVESELHATDLVNGRGRISKRVPDRYCHDGSVFWKDFGRDVVRLLLAEIGSLEGLTVGSVFERFAPDPDQGTKTSLYRKLVQHWERELVREDGLALVFVDGNGTDHSYRTTHRSFDVMDQRIIEDPVMTDSAQSQFVQIADLVAWSAYAAVEQPPRHDFAWGWYERHLAVRDPRRVPLDMAAFRRCRRSGVRETARPPDPRYRGGVCTAILPCHRCRLQAQSVRPLTSSRPYAVPSRDRPSHGGDEAVLGSA